MSLTDLALIFVIVLVFAREGLRARLTRSSAAPMSSRRFIAVWLTWSIVVTGVIAFTVQVAIGIGSLRLISEQLENRR